MWYDIDSVFISTYTYIYIYYTLEICMYIYIYLHNRSMILQTCCIGASCLSRGRAGPRRSCSEPSIRGGAGLRKTEGVPPKNVLNANKVGS